MGYADSLEHYGVKGMKWDVRKEYEPVSSRTKNDYPDSYTIESERLKGVYMILDQMAGTEFKAMELKLKHLADKTGIDAFAQLSSDYSDSLWAACYKEVVNGVNLSEEERLLLVVYGYLERYGLEDYFDIGMQNEGTGKRTIIITDKKAVELSMLSKMLYDLQEVSMGLLIQRLLQNQHLGNCLPTRNQ